jgi:hypothetical protein
LLPVEDVKQRHLGRGYAPRLIALALVLTSAFAVGRARGFEGNIQGNELFCEEAVARLEQCCGQLERRFQCVFREPEWSEPGCEESVLLDPGVSPDIDMDESACLRRMSCEAMNARGTCTAAREQEAGGALCR